MIRYDLQIMDTGLPAESSTETGELFTLVYGELRGLAARYLRRERIGHTLQPTALVHEAYLELNKGGRAPWKNRAHFFGTAALVMRRVLVQHARRRRTLKRGEGRLTTFVDGLPGMQAATCDLSVLDHALTRLEQSNPILARIVEVRVFGGLTMDEAAEFLEMTPRMARRRWELAQLWLYREVIGDDACRETGKK